MKIYTKTRYIDKIDFCCTRLSEQFSNNNITLFTHYPFRPMVKVPSEKIVLAYCPFCGTKIETK